MQHHLGTDLFKGGVYDPTKTVETFSRGKDRHLAPMEVRAVPARDWARLWQATSRSSMPSQFESDPRRRKTERFPATGKAICWPVERTAILRRWWSGIHGFSC